MSVYGGVRADIDEARQAINHTSHPEEPRRDAGSPAKDLVFTAVDLPFSFLGDTLTLPITIPASMMRQQKLNVQRKADEPWRIVGIAE